MRSLLILFLGINFALFSQSFDEKKLIFIGNASSWKNNCEKLAQLEKLKNGEKITGIDSVFTILHFGDSHIQGDYFSGQIREGLQTDFGNAGNGIIFPYGVAKSWGPRGVSTVLKGTWTSSNTLKSTASEAMGVKGFLMRTTNKNSEISFQFTDKYKGDFSSKVRFWYAGDSSFSLTGGKFISSQSNSEGWETKTYAIEKGKGFSLKRTAQKDSSFTFNGFEFLQENPVGVRYHQLGVVGAQFTHLLKNQSYLISQIKALEPELVLFSFGSNEAYNSTMDFEAYQKSIIVFLEKLVTEIPTLTVIITTPPDTRSNGRTPKCQKGTCEKLVDLQKVSNTLVFDLNEASGGWSSLNNWYKAGLAQGDKLHFKAEGYALQGKLFLASFYTSYHATLGSENKNPWLVEVNPIMGKMFAEKPLDSIAIVDSVGVPPSKPPVVIKKPVTTKYKTHTVKSGETVSRIAQKYHVSAAKIISLNRLSKNGLIRTGQKLKIPK